MNKHQNRPPPAYQEYASSMLANYNFRTLPLETRGVLYTLRLECWVNKQVPCDEESLTKLLGIPPNEVQLHLNRLKPFLKIKDEWLFCPELDDYRTYLEARHKAQSQGGKKGAAKTNALKQPPSSQPQDTRRASRVSLAEHRTGQTKSTQSNSVIKEEDIDEWVDDFDKTDYT